MAAARKGDWVRVHGIVLTSDERAPQIPEDTKAVPLEIWTKGFLQADEADLGETVQVKTLTGRMAEGELVEMYPTYTHSFGNCVPELLQIGLQLREILFGGETDER